MGTIAGPTGPTPQEYVLGNSEAFAVEAVSALFDGSGAAGPFLPTVSFYSSAGRLIARQFAEEQTAGEVSEVTFAPFLRRPEAVPADELPSLCGGMAVGPIASGFGPASSLVLTVKRTVDCDALVVVVPAYLSLNTPLNEGGAPSSVVDSHGNNYHPGAGTSFGIGAIGQSIGGPPFSRLEGGNSWQFHYAPGVLKAGDTLTVNFGLTYPANATIAALAFAVVHVSDVSSSQTFGGAGPFVTYGNADSYPGTSADPTTLDWCADLAQCNPQNPRPVHFSAGLSLACSYPDESPYFPFSGVVIGELGGWGAALAVTMDRCVLDDDGTYSPGGFWNSGAQMLVGNYQFARFVCP